MKKQKIYWLVTAIAVLTLGWYGASAFSGSSNKSIFREDIVTRDGLHWHPILKIYAKGVEQEIPKDIGLGVVEQPIHTHDANGTIHLEFSGFVPKGDTTLGQFFRVWGKDFNSFGANVKMTVNEKENVEFENYQMRDGDRIELRYN